jgi:hypothetical protein
MISARSDIRVMILNSLAGKLMASKAIDALPGIGILFADLKQKVEELLAHS